MPDSRDFRARVMAQGGLRGNAPSSTLLVAAALATLVVSALFVLAPGIDLAVTSVFYDRAAGFATKDNATWLFIREAGFWVTKLAVASLVMAGIAKAVRPEQVTWFSWRQWLFLAVVWAIGPGLIVDVILKSNWGRARPNDIVDFGGAMPFSPAWYIVNNCPKNCSFVSGEAAASFATLAFAFVVAPGWRMAVAVVAVVWAALISFSRVAFGAHFLSDILIGWCLMLLVMVVAQRLLLGGRADEPRRPLRGAS